VSAALSLYKVPQFWDHTPLCRCAASPPKGWREGGFIWLNFTYLSYFSPSQGECPKGEGVVLNIRISLIFTSLVECPKGKGVVLAPPVGGLGG